MRLYFDCCCYNRPFDDQSQQRVHDESEAILSLMNRCIAVRGTILGSAVLRLEIDSIGDTVKREKVRHLYRAVNEDVGYTSMVRQRAEEICQHSAIHEMDALHISSAEMGRTDVFLTTDARLIRSCRSISLRVRVMNPVSYLAEVIEYDGY
jgi:hypothetical protein